ncbi:bifunctional 4-hydroxy-2-oxoglutarate aldolase/2-dehydro-3-deoxy-phosphogluconate aldolase [Microbacterium gubbeenense]|uniref:bifunctional 4-hydroxy-2-oxoglutarate aldolase/2-dehydro-3-deoxy-phosphogluconate aldolase n=1 Tax=Microbacterium gubbeenense TaxID=159896 RepID=UPI003F9A15A0
METGSDWFDQIFTKQPIMAILRGYSPEETVRISRLAWEAGIDAVEVPVQSPDAFEALEAAVEAGKAEDKPVGAGTVISLDQVREVARVGGAFTVAPGFDREIAVASERAGLPHLPGVATGSDVQAALKIGIYWQKAFPASVLGKEWFAAMHGPFPQVKFAATGGIGMKNAAEYLRAGAGALSFGSALDDPAQREEIAAFARTLRS